MELSQKQRDVRDDANGENIHSSVAGFFGNAHVAKFTGLQQRPNMVSGSEQVKA